MIKKLFIISALFAALVACEPSKKETVVSILYDYTDAHLSTFDADGVIYRYHIESNKWEGFIFRYQGITGSDYHPITEAILISESELLSNSLERDKKIKDFIFHIMSCKTDTIKGEDKSSIFIPLVREIEYLCKNYPNQECEILLYSNLMENTDWISWYDTSTKNNAQTEEKYAPYLPEISKKNGVHLKIIYTPTASENKRFREVTNLYQKLCDRMHIKLSIVASIS